MTTGRGCYTFGMAAGHPALTVYTDGACRGNPGPGGWAWAVPDGPFASGANPHTTNQRMEIAAALEALRALREDAPGGILVVSDSTYVVKCFTDEWWRGWQRRNWKNTANKPVANRDLWEPLLALALGDDVDVSFRWVKGHSGDRWNDRVDELATQAADSGVGTSG
jgi:ribonuclease HI